MKTLVLVCLTACGPVAVGELSPSPKVLVDGQAAMPLALSLSADIKDAFTTHDPLGAANTQWTIAVSAWRRTLTNAFDAAFSHAFTIGGAADVTLQIVAANLSYIYCGGDTSECAQIEYQARVVNKAGETLATCAGTARGQAGYQAMPITKDAVEIMFQQMANALFSRPLPK